MAQIVNNRKHNTINGIFSCKCHSLTDGVEIASTLNAAL